MRKPDAEGSAKNLNPKTTFREGKNVTPAVPDSPHSRSGIGTGIGNGIDTRRRQGRATNRRGQTQTHR
jgi:hypothetical protein